LKRKVRKRSWNWGERKAIFRPLKEKKKGASGEKVAIGKKKKAANRKEERGKRYLAREGKIYLKVIKQWMG